MSEKRKVAAPEPDRISEYLEEFARMIADSVGYPYPEGATSNVHPQKLFAAGYAAGALYICAKKWRDDRDVKGKD